jgi:hypothetical protein
MQRSINTPLGLLSRRDWLRLSTAGVFGGSMCGWLGPLAARAADDPKSRRSCIVIWLAGGPSQLETWDPKPEHKNGGPTKSIATSVTGIRISEHLPKLAKHMDRMVLVRSMNTAVEEHGQGAVLMSTGHLENDPVDYPSVGAAVSKELENAESPLPNYVSLRSPYGLYYPRAYSPGFLGPRHAPVSLVPTAEALSGAGDRLEAYDKLLRLPNVKLSADVTEEQAGARMDLMRDLDRGFNADHPSRSGQGHRLAYERAASLLLTPAAKAFSLSDEPEKLRDSYGRNLFGQSCLLARRLVERGVPFVEIALGPYAGQSSQDWDMHTNIFESIPPLCQVLDTGWAALMADLKEKGLLDDTLIVCMGEFGRTPQINGAKGRDHWAKGWSTVLAGAGLKGGQVIGRTSDDGMAIEDRPVTVSELLATIYSALAIDPQKKNMMPSGRPIRLVDAEVEPIKEALR